MPDLKVVPDQPNIAARISTAEAGQLVELSAVEMIPLVRCQPSDSNPDGLAEMVEVGRADAVHVVEIVRVPKRYSLDALERRLVQLDQERAKILDILSAGGRTVTP